MRKYPSPKPNLHGNFELILNSLSLSFSFSPRWCVPGVLRGQKRAADPLELELWMTVGQYGDGPVEEQLVLLIAQLSL